jgi:hypothetical protein
MRGKILLQLVSGSIAIYAIMAACSQSGPSGSAPGSGLDGAAVLDAVTDPVPQDSVDPNQSGSRLKAHYRGGTDGSKAFAWVYDSMLNFSCDLSGLAADGTARCLPADVSSIGWFNFLDAACSQPVLALRNGCAPPGYLTISDQHAGPQARHAYRVGNPVTPANVYTLVSSSDGGMTCGLLTRSGGCCYYSLGAELPPSAFVQISVQRER